MKFGTPANRRINHHSTKVFPLKIRSIRALCFLVLLAGGVVSAKAAEKGKGLGDGHDGSLAAITHLISLYDEKGIAIKATDKQSRPVSMRKTCGECHNYDEIAAGWHFHSGSCGTVACHQNQIS